MGIWSPSPGAFPVFVAHALGTGWGVHLQGLTMRDYGQEEFDLHVNILEMKVVRQALNTFRKWIMGESVVMMRDSVTVVAYTKKQGGTVCAIWYRRFSLEQNSLRYILGKKNILANQLSSPDQVLLTKWSFLPRAFNAMCKEYRCPHIDIFNTRSNVELPCSVSCLICHGWKGRCLPAQLG